MGFNGRIREWVLREKWKATVMEGEQKLNHKNRIYTEYNFNSGFMKKIYDAIIEDMRKSQITKLQMPTIMSRCGLSAMSIRRKMQGKEETHVYELEPMLKTLNYKVNFNYSENEILRISKVSANYTYTQELDRIIIKRNLYPKFFINFNPDKPEDFEIDFHQETLKFPIKERNMINFVLAGIETFYKTEKLGEKRKIMATIRKEIRRQFLNGEILVHPKSNKKIK